MPWPSSSRAARMQVASSAPMIWRMGPRILCSAGITQVTIAAGSTQQSFYFRDPTAGTPTLTARVSGLTDGTQVATINRGPAAKLAFITPPRTPIAGACSAALTVQSQDATGNAVPFAAAAVVALTTSSSTGGPYLDAACTTPATQLTVPSGASAGTFYFKDTVTGPWGVTATAPGLTAAAQTVTVVAGPAALLVLRTLRQTIQAGACSSVVSAEVEDALGNLVPAQAVTPVALSSSATSTRFFLNGACSGAVSSVDLGVGESRLNFHFRDDRVGTPLVRITVPGLAAVVQAETIVAGPPAQLAFVTPAQTVAVNTCSARAVIEVQDSVGNPSAQSADAIAALGSSSGSGTFFADQKCLTTRTQLALPADGGQASFYFLDTATGTPTLTASSAGLQNATQQQTFATPGLPVSLVFASAPASLEALSCSEEERPCPTMSMACGSARWDMATYSGRP